MSHETRNDDLHSQNDSSSSKSEDFLPLISSANDDETRSFVKNFQFSALLNNSESPVSVKTGKCPTSVKSIKTSVKHECPTFIKNSEIPIVVEKNNCLSSLTISDVSASVKSQKCSVSKAISEDSVSFTEHESPSSISIKTTGALSSINSNENTTLTRSSEVSQIKKGNTYLDASSCGVSEIRRYSAVCSHKGNFGYILKGSSQQRPLLWECPRPNATCRENRAKRKTSRSRSIEASCRLLHAESPHRLRQRFASIPNDFSMLHSNLQDERNFLRLRNFSVSSKGIFNHGDTFRSRVDRSLPCQLSKLAHSVTDSFENSGFPVAVVGTTEVGKSSLIYQFTTCENICEYENSEEERSKTVTVVLNQEESKLLFLEECLPEDKDPVNDMSIQTCDAHVVVYSVVSRFSFQKARMYLGSLTTLSETADKAVILVGNKTDLVRLRIVSTNEGRTVAKAYGCKFIETSAGINHNVDELLVGILSQIRLKRQYQEQLAKKRESVTFSKSLKQHRRSSVNPKKIIKRVFDRAIWRSKSCDNLHVL
ncbi:uncharacterized protein LOC111088278 [Limulus polyphemus]|uniref:Uncharacterized protein LOC111088278 n=1 Tax=Limulus polyphemus TaxID=6850 RepID=A0ABM1TCN5_LIMPO|nr:uncharacterized protein LOC111088278 [Limulus polyphemus]